MTVTVSCKNYSVIDACENASNWSGETPADVTDFYKEGSQCVGFTMKDAGNNDTYLSGSWDLSGTKHLHFWFMTNNLKQLNTDANGGVQLYLSDGTNTGYYYVSGSTTYPGGWYNIVIDLSRNVDSGTKPTMTAITTIGIRVNLASGAKNVQNTWVDHVYIGDGLIAYGDVSGSPFDFDDILSVDEDPTNGGWGIIRKIAGIYFLVGSLDFGDGSSTNSSDFKDTSQAIVFEDRKVNSNLYAFTVVGNATGGGKFQLGDKSGTQGVSGCLVRVQSLAQTAKFDITCTDTDVTDFKLYGCVFLDADSTSLPVNGSNREALNCSWESCGEILASTCKMQYCTVISANNRGLRITSNSHQVTYCTFISCTACIHINVSTTIDFSNLTFIGSNGTSLYDIEHSVSGTLTINATDSNPQYVNETGGGSTTINNTVALTVHVEDEDGNDLQYAWVGIFKLSDRTQLMNEQTNSSGIATENFNYLGDTDIEVRVRLASGEPDYEPWSTKGTIVSTGYYVNVILKEDEYNV